ncbi:MAG: RtcB family protein [Candidatus Lambdaproteobacteria bacterium]|nr:RtcB family protein [Candidatus Lambdaproteobacteria bacterium]
MPQRLLEHTSFPVQVWAPAVEEQAERQLRNLARLPILFHHVAVMPDVHWGLGATVGSVLASAHAVIPAAVGVDIGCGMCAVRLPFTRSWLEEEGRLHRIREAIERTIPVGFEQYRPGQVSPEAEAWAREHVQPGRLRAALKAALLEKARLQLGTLGGGNHFIEVCHDETGRAWVLLHSGSRHIGKALADHHIRLARSLMQRKGELDALPDRELAYFLRSDPEFDDYLADLFWAQAYAQFNRDEMMRRILLEIAYYRFGDKDQRRLAALTTERVDCHHNYVARELHFGQRVYVTRKGAVSARKGEPGIIPGSMGARSYVVVGKGNPDSFHSCAHGAGRQMSRHEAKRRYSVQDLAVQTEGVDCRKDKGVLDEIPKAYKDIDEVMAAQADLVEVRHTLKQLLCVKG